MPLPRGLAGKFERAHLLNGGSAGPTDLDRFLLAAGGGGGGIRPGVSGAIMGPYPGGRIGPVYFGKFAGGIGVGPTAFPFGLFFIAGLTVAPTLVASPPSFGTATLPPSSVG